MSAAIAYGRDVVLIYLQLYINVGYVAYTVGPWPVDRSYGRARLFTAPED